MPINKTLHLSLAKADIHIPANTEPDMLGRVIEAAQRQRTETQRRVRLGLPIGNVRLSEWERVTLKRGPNKGKTAWKKGNRYFHGEKPPEGRGSKQEAGAKGKAAPKPKADKVTPQAMVEKHKAIMAKGSTSHEDMQGFIDDLLSMTVKDINEVKKSLGLKASGKKAELAKKIGEKAFELVGKVKAEKTNPEPKQADKNIDSMSPGKLYKYAKELGITPGKSKPQNMKLIKEHLAKK